MSRAVDALRIAIPFVWFGMVLAISVLETPLKFRAPGITPALGLGIGRLVFRALNVAELILLAALTAAVAGAEPGSLVVALLTGLWIVLLVQALALRPALDRRAQLIMDGRTPPRSSLHLVYVALEGAKLLAVPTLGTLLILEALP
jgi:hypothetical protein